MKQLKSRAQDLRNLFESNITVADVAEKLQYCSATDDARVIRQYMKDRDFDVFGIEDKGIICGYIEQASLENGPCMQYQCEFHASDLIAESTPLMDLLPILRDGPRIFVLDRNRVSGIVTRGDLQKAPVRMLFFGLVTLLEMQLLRLIGVYYPRESWQKCIKSHRLEDARKLQAERPKTEVLSLINYLRFCDKRQIILSSTKARMHIGFNSVKSGARLLKAAERLRDKLAHAQDLVAGSSWSEIIDLAQKIEKLVERCENIENDGKTY